MLLRQQITLDAVLHANPGAVELLGVGVARDQDLKQEKLQPAPRTFPTAWAAITSPTPAATPSTPCSPPPATTSDNSKKKKKKKKKIALGLAAQLKLP